jgi:hypothetical protein
MKSKAHIKKVISTIKKTNQKVRNKPVQPQSVGEGPTYHRTYSIEIINPIISPLRVMEQLQKDINTFCPSIMVRFEKMKGSKSELKVGDEFFARLTGPWNSPTRVDKVKEHGFHMKTLEGSMEAGEIQMYLTPKGKHWVFTIESLAKSRDKLIDLLYDKIPVIKLGQAAMWVYVCEQFNQRCKGSPNTVKVVTKKENKISDF